MIEQEVKEVLRNAEYGSNYVRLEVELERSLYEKVNTVLTRLQGKWGKKEKAHVFPFNPKPVVLATLEVGKLPEKNPTAFFPTPKNLVNDMFRMADRYFSGELVVDDSEIDILEPSAGQGSIAEGIREIFPNARIDTVEYLDINQKVLKEKGFDPWCGDFIEFNKDYSKKYRYIFMNPPFSLKHDKHAYITHVEHALNMLEDWGTLVAIVAPGFLHNNTKKERAFYDKVMELGELEEIPPGEFKESGTMIKTVMLTLTKRSWRTEPCNGFPSQMAWNFAITVDSWSELGQRREDLINRMVKKGTFDEKAAADFCESAIDELKRSGVYSFAYGRIDEYVLWCRREFQERLEYETGETVEPDVEVPLEEEVPVIEVKPTLTVKELKKATPTLFDVA